MNEEEERFMRNQENELNTLKSDRNVFQSTQAQQSQIMQDQERNIIKEQLDLSEELDKIENLLKGNVLQRNQSGQLEWVSPKNNEMVILSEHGIHLIMNSISFYINKNTLLSNYDLPTINQKMEDFSTDLSDTIFMEYEKVFQYPTFQDCKNILNDRIQRKTELRKFSYELLGKDANEKDIKDNILKDFEGRVEGEIEKIKEQLIKNKLKRFLILIREIQDAIHSTYLRALAGQERKTLREHIHVSESRGGNSIPQQQNKPSGPLNWFRR